MAVAWYMTAQDTNLVRELLGLMPTSQQPALIINVIKMGLLINKS